MSQNLFATPMVGTKRGKAWKAMVAKTDGTCSGCKKSIAKGDKIVIRQIGSRLNARHEGCRDMVPAPVVVQVDEDVYRIKREPVSEGSKQKKRSFDPTASLR